MKIIRLFLFICIFSNFSILSFGQLNKGNIMMGADTKLNLSSFSSKWKTDNDEEEFGKTFNFGISPQIGIFAAKNFAIGLNFPVSIYSEENNNDIYKTNSVGIGPFIRAYIGSDIVKPYLHNGVVFGRINIEDDPANAPSDSYSAKDFIYEIGGGIGIFLNEKVSIDISVTYVNERIKPDETANNNNFRIISSGIDAGIGFVIILSAKNK